MPRSRSVSSLTAYGLLFAFTLLQGVAIGSITMWLPLALILRAALVTAVATGGLSIYALTTKRDFTPQAGAVVTVLLALSAIGLLQVGLLPEINSRSCS